VVVRDRVLRSSLVLLLVAAGTLLPVSSLLVPVLARDRGWTAGQAGTVAGGVALGTGVVLVVVLVWRAARRPGVVGPLGLLASAAGIVGLAAAGSPAAAVAAALLVGAGTGVFTAHVGPLLLGQAPAAHLARVQAVLGIVQSVSLLAGNALLGLAADLAGAAPVLFGCAAALVLATSATLVRGTMDAVR
jgi:hypothetical protein